MLKHAYLIMAHGSQFQQLNYLLRMLDHENNSIYLHIDKKSPTFSRDEIVKGIQYSNVEIYQEIKVYWGDYSQTECELFLLEKAVNDKYDYYHLLSGEDLPLKSQNQIHKFFEDNNGKEYVRFWGDKFPQQSIEWVSHYHPLQKFLRKSKYKLINVFFVVLDKFIQLIQRFLKVNRIKNNHRLFQKGATWFSITDALAQEIVNSKQWIKHTFSSTRSSDEIFVQTILCNSKLVKNRFENTYETDGLSGLRYIDWKRGKPYTFRDSDFSELINNDFLFARKFNFKIDKDIILKLYNFIKEQD